MWDKGKERADVPKTAGEPRNVAESPPRTTSFTQPRLVGIGKTVTIKGQITSHEDLYVDGEVQGTIDVSMSCLTIGPNGRAEAGAGAREIIVYGAINGNVEASERVTICKEGRVVGDIRATRIVIEEGGYVKGKIDIAQNASSVEKAQSTTPAVPSNPP